MDVGLMTLAGIFAGGVVAGVAADMLRVYMKDKKRKASEETLRRNFGEASNVTTFTFDEAMEWITARDELMQNGCSAMIFKVNNETLKTVNKKFNIDFGVEKYLAIVITKEPNKKFLDSVLIKYDRLDSRLENELAQGKGSMIIGD